MEDQKTTITTKATLTKDQIKLMICDALSLNPEKTTMGSLFEMHVPSGGDIRDNNSIPILDAITLEWEAELTF